MGRHPQGVSRMRPSSAICSTSPRSAEVLALSLCICLYAGSCVVHVSAQPSAKGNSTTNAHVAAKNSINVALTVTIVAAVIASTALATFLSYYCYHKRYPVGGPPDIEKFAKQSREEAMLSYADAKVISSAMSTPTPTPKATPKVPIAHSGGSTFSNRTKGNNTSAQSTPPIQANNASDSEHSKGRWTFSLTSFSGFKWGNQSTSGVVIGTGQDWAKASISMPAADVKRATRNFGCKIGEGGFGSVYFGKLPGSQLEVAVKVQAKESHQGAREFATEVEILSRCRHPNLVSLVGYSEEESGYMLVYEFLGGGTLQQRLYGNRSNPPLAWSTRLKIAVQAAKGLEYLHDQCVPSIIHRDVKSNNVVLTKHDEAKVTDFGLSKFLGASLNGISRCSVKGTSGYLDPEYFETQTLTHKSDVYSFGIVLLEIVSGLEPLNTAGHRTEWKINDWARKLLKEGDIEKVADKALNGKYDSESMWIVAELGMACVEPRSAHRPTISEVVLELEKAIKEQSTP